MTPQTPGRGWPKGKEGNELRQALLPDEQVLGWEQGRSGALLVATDQRVLIIKTGMATGQVFGRKVSAWPYQQIISVDMQTTFGSGWVEIVTAGMQARRGGAWSKSADAYQADNMVAFLGNDQPWRPLVNLLRERVQHAQQPQQPAAPTTASPSIPEQIEQLARLRDAGILSPAEFDAKKAELLRRM